MVVAATALVLSSVVRADRPNIVVIFTDDHAAQAVSAYGSRINRTPNIDAIARRGVRFDRFYTANPICAPSRATMLTGKYSHINGHKDNSTSFDGSQPTFPKLLHAAGYATALIGKWHLESKPQGFDHWEILPGQGSYYNPDFVNPSGTHRETGYVTDLITDKALGWLDARPKSAPFLLMVQHKAPHRNWEPAPRHFPLFADRDVPEPADLFRDYDGLASGATATLMQIGRDMNPKVDLKFGYTPPRMNAEQAKVWDAFYSPLDKEGTVPLQGKALVRRNYQRYIKDYLRCVAAVDDGVGRVLDYLKRSGLEKNTVVVYASDQGFFLGEFGWYDKRWFYEPSSRTPLIVAWPGGAAGKATSRLASNVDVAPTLLDLAGVAVPRDMQGYSLKSLLQNPAGKPARTEVYGHFYESDDPDHKAPRYMAWRDERHKVIFYDQLGEWELFDLQRDPGETRNLARDPGQHDLLVHTGTRLLAEMRAVREEPDAIAKVETALKSLQARPGVGACMPSSTVRKAAR